MTKRRYCEMCDEWVSVKQTTCRACGSATSQVVEYCEACDAEGKTAGGDTRDREDHTCFKATVLR